MITAEKTLPVLLSCTTSIESSTTAATDLLPALPAALLLQTPLLFPIPKCLKLLVVIKTQAFLSCLTWVLKELGAQMRNFLFLEKELERERGNKSKESCLQPTFACNSPTLFIFLGGVGFAQISSCSELLELVRNQESTWKLGTLSSNNKERRRTHTIIITNNNNHKRKGKKNTLSFVGTQCPINDDVYVLSSTWAQILNHPPPPNTHTQKYTCCIHTDLCMYTTYGIWLSI